jgi:predicted  nucleic acid-binding Zn-ribbon protein
MRQIKSSLELVKNRRVRTTNSLSKTDGEISHLKSLTDGQVEQVLAKERKRFAAREAAVDKSRQRLLKARDKLAATINKNRALTELRHQLQQVPIERKSLVPEKALVPAQKPKPPTRKKIVRTRKPKLRQVKLKY